MSTVLAHAGAAVLALAALALLGRGRWRVGLALVGVVALSACEPVDPSAGGQGAGRSAERNARDIGRGVLDEPGDPPLIVTRVYRYQGMRCFEASVEWTTPDGVPHSRFHRDCAKPTDPADVRAHIARQRIGKQIKD